MVSDAVQPHVLYSSHSSQFCRIAERHIVASIRVLWWTATLVAQFFFSQPVSGKVMTYEASVVCVEDLAARKPRLDA